MEPIEVTAHFEADGQVNPLSFARKGVVHTVESTGRRWSDEQGQHILVMVPGGKVFELVFAAGEGRWYLGRVPPPDRHNV